VQFWQQEKKKAQLKVFYSTAT